MHPDNCPLLHGEGFCFESEIALQMRPYLFRIVIGVKVAKLQRSATRQLQPN